MRPLILITNDDGIKSPGLMAAAEAVEELGDILIAAPHTQQTGMGRAFLRTEESGIIEETILCVNGRDITAYGIHGTPGFAVAHAVLELADRKPDLCISGINYGENLGMTLTCSGTLGAVFEAGSHQIPGIAVSLEADLSVQRSNEFEMADFGSAKKILRLWAGKVLKEGMENGVDIWNINVPSTEEMQGQYKITSQSRQNYFEFIRPGKREFQKPYALKTERCVDIHRLEKDSDIHAVYVDKMISVTPVSLDMTAGR